MLEGQQHLFGLKTLQRRLSERGKQKARTVASSGFSFWPLAANGAYFLLGGTSMQRPGAVSAAMPMHAAPTSHRLQCPCR